MATPEVKPEAPKELKTIPDDRRGQRKSPAAPDVDGHLVKQIQATHDPDGLHVEAKFVFPVLQKILQNIIDFVETPNAFEDKVAARGLDISSDLEDLLDGLAYIVHKVSSELSCKSASGEDVHGTTMILLNMLSSYEWDAKLIITLAALAANYEDQLLLVSQFHVMNNPLAKAISAMKPVGSYIMENFTAMKDQLSMIDKLFRSILQVTKCVIIFEELPPELAPAADKPPMAMTITHIPLAVYWTIRSIIVCQAQIPALIGMDNSEYLSTSSEQALLSMARKLDNIYDYLNHLLNLCYKQIEETNEVDQYSLLAILFERTHFDNTRILKELFCVRNINEHPLIDGKTKEKVDIQVLQGKVVLLLITNLDPSYKEELLLLRYTYQESRLRPGANEEYEIVWLPIVEGEKAMIWSAEEQHMFDDYSPVEMEWYSLSHPGLLSPAVIKYIREAWHFKGKPIVVSLDPQGKVASLNAMNMLFIWNMDLCYPFSTMREKALWRDIQNENGKLIKLLLGGIKDEIFDWIHKGRIICLYGGVDMGWIRDFTNEKLEKYNLENFAGRFIEEMVYVGKSSNKGRVRGAMNAIAREGLSHTLDDDVSVGLFWRRLEAMWCSRIIMQQQQHMTSHVENDGVMEALTTILGFDSGCDEGWAAVFSGDSAEMAAAAGGGWMVHALTDIKQGLARKLARSKKNDGFVAELRQQLKEIATDWALHCVRLTISGLEDSLPETVVPCPDCRRPMERCCMYRCCI